MTKPHLVHATLEDEGLLWRWWLECPYEGDVDKAGRNCIMANEDGSPEEGNDECAAKTWLDAMGGEVVSCRDLVNPRFPLEADPVWEFDNCTIAVRVIEAS